MNVASEYIDRERLAADLNINVRTLDRWHRERKGPPRTVLGSRVFYRMDALRAWMLSNEQISTAPPAPPARPRVRSIAR